MVIRRTETLDLADVGHSRSARDAALARAHDAALGAVLDDAAEDIDIGFRENDSSLSVSASLTTLSAPELAAFAALMQAHGKGYSAGTLARLVGDLARVFRR